MWQERDAPHSEEISAVREKQCFGVQIGLILSDCSICLTIA